MQYRRVFIPGGTYFFTLVTYQRKPIFSSIESIDLLRNAFRYTMQHHPFTIVACVILPDHLHFIWSMPNDCSDFSLRWRLIKSYFSHHWYEQTNFSDNPSRTLKGEKEIWQRRFWEHLIQDENDLEQHIEYIHNNPVKHGYVNSPDEWRFSSFKKFDQNEFYDNKKGNFLPSLDNKDFME